MSSTAHVGTATIDSPPADGQIVQHNGNSYSTIKEGKAFILVPPNAKTITDPKATKNESAEKAQQVFYNPIQQFNRDLSVLAIRAFSEDFLARKSAKSQRKSAQSRRTRERKPGKAQESRTLTNGGPEAHRDHEEQPQTASTKSNAVNDANAKFDEGEAPIAQGAKRRAEDEIEESEDTKRHKINESDQTESHDSGANRQTITAETAAEPSGPEKAAKAGDGNRPNDTDRKTMRILDALSATGLRALRYASELPLATFVVANDLLPSATGAINVNVKHNKLTKQIHAVTSNAQAHMYNAAFANAGHTYGKYDVIDLDPYGTAVPFLEAALLALNDDGLLCVTCTDAGVFNSLGYLEKTYALYGGIPIKGFHAHEGGLRLILNAIATSAAKHGLAIEPLLSLSIDFYARVWVRVRKSAADVKFLAGRTLIVHNCDTGGGCGAWSTQSLARTSTAAGKDGTPFNKHHPALTYTDKLCEHCGSKTHLAGPMWGGPLHNPWFIERVLGLLSQVDDETYATKARVEGMLTSALDELEVITAFDELEAEMKKKQEQPAKKPDVSSTDKSKPEETASDDAVAIKAQSEKTAPLAHRIIPAVPASIADPHPFAVNASQLARAIKTIAPPEALIKGALRHMGYVATRSHTRPGMIKTQAPWSAVWRVMREFVRTRAPVKEGSHKEGSPGHRLLYGVSGEGAAGAQKSAAQENIAMVNGHGAAAQSATGAVDDSGKLPEIVFDEALGKDRPGKRLVRYQVNPRANWGPMSRARG